MRCLAELRDTDTPAITFIEEWVTEASHPVVLLQPGPRAADVLLALQVTRRSTLGALAHDTGGILIDGGWLRMYGGGCAVFPRDLVFWNRLDEPHHRLPGAIVVAEDVLGGFFAIDGGGLGLGAGTTAYLSPDSQSWEDLGMGHTQWVAWALTGDLAAFYRDMRWPGWQNEIAALTPERGISIYPPLWAAGPPTAERSRRPVPIEELWALHVENSPLRNPILG